MKHWGRIVPCISLCFTFLRQSALLPSRSFQEHFLGLFGFDGELVMGAFVLAGFVCSGFGIGVVKNEEVSPAHVRSVVVDLGLLETCHEVGDWDEELAIVCDH